MAGNEIFKKYFRDDGAHNVKKIFENIIGKDTTSGNQDKNVPNHQGDSPCANVLRDITIRHDFPDPKYDGEKSCVDKDGKDIEYVMGDTREGDTDHPKIVICPPALAHRGIKKGYDKFFPPGPKAVTCDTLDKRASWKMETLGSILLHEYTYVAYPGIN